MTLCGITIRFQMLFHSERQVTHALLTRPPLIHPSVGRSLRQNFIVRLACVKHAASVRPEPGSNSLKIVLRHPVGRSNHFQSFVAHFVIADLFFILRYF